MNNKVLVIEDNKNLAELIQVNLETHGLSVITSFDGEDGLAKALKEIPDVITLDIQLPKMNGWEVCKKIKADSRTKDIPVIFLTVIPKTDGEDIAKEVGCDLYLTKPFDPLKLVNIVKRFIEKKKSN